ncbi:hypothetical protein EJ02DRAFT_457354 [Clathrospora elynae]|uniref:Uncharacterized protein n=1 Tax=Clathrospora elynae TaxID=706981 RepID=A0A6A5SH68_9PLEO|nr:hypothetical protein EJ02DRAFT_457354 [Clathrospora elynae]
MFKLSLQTSRFCSKRPSSFSRRYVRSSSSSAPAVCIDQAVNEFQAARATTNAGRIVNKLCTRLAQDRATTRTEQLVWLAQHCLEISAVGKSNGVQDQETTVERRREDHEDKTTSATSNPVDRPS